MGNLCEKHSTMREQGLRFVDTIAKLMERLLQYRDIIHAESQEHRMLCIVNLLEFYSEINRKEMYIRYVINNFNIIYIIYIVLFKYYIINNFIKINHFF